MILQNLFSWQTFGGSRFLSAVILGTLIYIIFGFIKRRPAARKIAIIFHFVYQVIMSFSFVLMMNPAFLQKFSKDLPAELLVLAKNVLIASFAVLTLINILAVRYLMRNADYFAEKEEAKQE
jgi:ABC-type transport system involved in cytochrome c biogenesis permease subunit